MTVYARPHVEDAKRGITLAAKLGYTARGVVYVVLGALALMAALGEGGSVTDTHGALREVGGLPWVGPALLYASALGLAGYALWSAVRAALDPEATPHERQKKTRMLSRVGYAISALTHGLLSAYALRLAIGASSSGDGTRSLVAKALAAPFGRVAVMIVGAIVVGFGLFQLYRAARNKLGREVENARARMREHRLVLPLARLGIAARGLVFPVMGASLISAAVHYRPAEVENIGGALREVQGHPLGGPVVLGVIAAGLVAYGLTQLVVARYASIRTGLGRSA